jgi:hypothetical protein
LGYDHPDDDPGSLEVHGPLDDAQEAQHSLPTALLSGLQPAAGSSSPLLPPAGQNILQVRHALVSRIFSTKLLCTTGQWKL